MHETDSQSVKIRLNHNNELECIFIQITTTTTTITKTSTSTSITDKHNKNLDDTLADIEELEESCVLDKNCIQISDDSDSSLPSINL